jgi:hypothetical protein
MVYPEAQEAGKAKTVGRQVERVGSRALRMASCKNSRFSLSRLSSLCLSLSPSFTFPLHLLTGRMREREPEQPDYAASLNLDGAAQDGRSWCTDPRARREGNEGK